MDQFVFSQGTMQTKVNNKIIDDKSYKFTYDGDMGKGFIKNNLDSYYVELDNDDLKKIFKKDKRDSVKLETKLKSLLNSKKKSKSKSKTKSISKKKTKTKSKTVKTKTTKTKSQQPKKTKKTFSKSLQKSNKTKKKSKKSKRKTKKMPLETNFLDTLV